MRLININERRRGAVRT